MTEGMEGGMGFTEFLHCLLGSYLGLEGPGISHGGDENLGLQARGVSRALHELVHAIGDVTYVG